MTIKYRSIEETYPVASKRHVPTIAECLAAIRLHVYPDAVAYSDGARCLEAGTRLDVDGSGDCTVDATRWAEDSGLFDFEDLTSILRRCRKTSPAEWPRELDLYVRNTEELVGNVDLRPSPNGWTLVAVFYRRVSE